MAALTPSIAGIAMPLARPIIGASAPSPDVPAAGAPIPDAAAADGAVNADTGLSAEPGIWAVSCDVASDDVGAAAEVGAAPEAEGTETGAPTELTCAAWAPSVLCSCVITEVGWVTA